MLPTILNHTIDSKTLIYLFLTQLVQHPIVLIMFIFKIGFMKENKYEIARKRVKAKKAFFEHLSTFLGMATFFLVLNIFTSYGRWWFYWPILGWGIAVLAHYVEVFGIPGVGQLDSAWEERAIQKELDKLNSEDGQSKKPTEDSLDLKPIPNREKIKKWNDEDLV